MHDIERELIKASKYKVQRKFDDRQDYLRSVYLATEHISDPQFLKLSEEAAEWINACTEAENLKRGSDFPDFDEVDPPSEPDGVKQATATDDPDEDEETDDDSFDEAEDDEAEAEDSEDDDSEDEDSAADDEGDDLDDDESDPPEEVAEDPATEPEEEPAPKKPAKKPAAPKKQPAKKGKAPKVPPKEPKFKEPGKRPRPVPGQDVTLDKWGCIAGSKNSQALAIFEAGATTREIKDQLGGTYYNVLKKVVEAGHRLEKYGAITKLIHRDEAVSSLKTSKKK